MSAFARGPLSMGRPMSRRSHVSVFVPQANPALERQRIGARISGGSRRSRRPPDHKDSPEAWAGNSRPRRGGAGDWDGLGPRPGASDCERPPAAGHCDFPRNWRAHLHYLARHAECWRHRWSGSRRCGGSGTGGSGGSSDALNTMLGQPWGSTAINNAEALGVNPSALAATCVIESGCQNVAGSGTVAGAFQMTASTFNSSLNAALQQDPSLAANVVQGTAGQMDPTTESIAASEYLYQGAHTLQNGGVTNPTVLDVRGFYNFGPQNGVALATAPADQPMSATLAGISSATLAANGITPGETVGQWRTAVSAKIGNTSSQPVLN